jgi:hypothetical protein
MTKWNACLRAAGLGVVAVLAGCAIAPPPISGAQKLTGEEGAVVFKLITNGTTAVDPAGTLSSVTLKREVAPGVKPTAQDTPILSRTRAVTHNTAVFSGMVAPGRYQLSHASGFQGNVTYTFPMGNVTSRFEVKRGEVSLLGTLVVQPLEARRFVVGQVLPEAEMSETFATLFPALAQQTRGGPVHTFEPSPDLQARQGIAAKIRQLPAAFNDPRAEADGTLLAGGRMGRIVWRKPPESRWRVLQLDTWKEVLAVRRYRGGLLAAGEEGLLRHSRDEGRTWQTLVPPDQGVIAAAEPLANGKVIALVRRDATWTAYASDDLMAGTWRRIGSFAQQQSLNVPWQNAIALAGGNRAGIMMPNGEFHVVDGNSETIEHHSTGLSTLGAEMLPDGMLVVRGAIVTATTLASKDGGKTWADLKTSRFVQAITFADADTAYAVGPVDPGLFAGTYALMVSRDGAKTWTKSGEVPGGLPGAASRLFYDRSDGSLLAFMQDGHVLRSADEGKTWTRSL